MKEFVIPVAFDVIVEDDSITEIQAATLLADRLAAAKLTGNQLVDSWWMPNHPAADRSDREAILIWVPVMSYAGRVTQGETPQQSVDSFMQTMARWSKPQ